MSQESQPQLFLAFLRASAAAANGRLDEFESIVQTNSSLIRWEDDQGKNLLIELCRTGASLCGIKFLIDRGANVDARAKTGETAFEYAMVRPVGREDDSLARCQLLVSAGANPNAVMGNGYTALQAAICLNRQDIVKLLLAHGANPSMASQDLPPSSTSDVIARSSHPEIWQDLLGLPRKELDRRR